MQENFRIFLPLSIKNSVEPHLKRERVTPYVHELEGEPSDVLQTILNDEALSHSYRLLILPESWLTSVEELKKEFWEKIRNTTLRLAFVTQKTPKPMNLPATVVSLDLPPEAQKALWSHLFRPPSWGVLTVLPFSGKIFTERLSTEAQIMKRVEQALHFIKTQNPDMKLQTLGLRFSLLSALSAALAETLGGDLKKTPVFQIGVANDVVAASIRWVDSSDHSQIWKSPPVQWQASFSYAQGAVVQTHPGSNESEVILIFSGSPSKGYSFPMGVDTLGTSRLNILKSFRGATEQFTFENFKAMGAPPEVEEDIPMNGEGSASQSGSSSNIQVEGMRLELKKQAKVVESLQKNLNESKRRLGKEIDKKKEVEQQVRSLKSQLGKLATLQKSQSQKIETLEKKLKKAKETEERLTNRLVDLTNASTSQDSSESVKKTG